MALPIQLIDKNNYPSGFYTVGTPYVLTDEQSVIFDAAEETAILIITSTGVDYAIGVNPTGSGTLHKAPAGAFPIFVPTGHRLYIDGTANISVIA